MTTTTQERDPEYHGRLVEWECREAIRLARLGYLLANGRLEEGDAGEIIHHCQPLAGWFPLETFDVEGVVEAAGCVWSNSADEIEPLARQASERVWQKWSGNGEAAGAAQDWALDLIASYAEADGVVLVEGEREEASR